MREWPPANLPGGRKAAAEHTMLRYLMNVEIVGAPLTKDEAWTRCKDDVPGAYPEAFKKAWKRLPPELKRGRGEHGPKVH